LKDVLGEDAVSQEALKEVIALGRQLGSFNKKKFLEKQGNRNEQENP